MIGPCKSAHARHFSLAAQHDGRVWGMELDELWPAERKEKIRFERERRSSKKVRRNGTGETRLEQRSTINFELCLIRRSQPNRGTRISPSDNRFDRRQVGDMVVPGV